MYLGSDVVPIMFAAELLEVRLKKRSHFDNAFRHALDLAQPLLIEPLVVQDRRGNACTMDRWVGVERPNQDLDLRVDTLLLFRRLAHDGESANTLAVEALSFRKQRNRVSVGPMALPCSSRSSALGIECDPPSRNAGLGRRRG